MADIPVFNKCCFCVPLRPGLMVLGSINAILSLIIILVTICNYSFYMVHHNPENYPGFNIISCTVLLVASLTIAVVSLSFTVLFLWAYKKRDQRKLILFYRFMIAKLITYSSAVGLGILMQICAYQIHRWVMYNNSDDITYFLIGYNPAAGIVDIILQSYFLLMLRSDLTKMRETKFSEQFERINNSYGNLPSFVESHPWVLTVDKNVMDKEPEKSELRI